MIVMVGIKAEPQILHVLRQADTFEVRVECPLDDRVIRQGIQYAFRDLLAAGQIDHLDGCAVYAVAKEQDLKIQTLYVSVHAALLQADGGVCL